MQCCRSSAFSVCIAPPKGLVPSATTSSVPPLGPPDLIYGSLWARKGREHPDTRSMVGTVQQEATRGWCCPAKTPLLSSCSWLLPPSLLWTQCCCELGTKESQHILSQKGPTRIISPTPGYTEDPQDSNPMCSAQVKVSVPQCPGSICRNVVLPSMSGVHTVTESWDKRFTSPGLCFCLLVPAASLPSLLGSSSRHCSHRADSQADTKAAAKQGCGTQQWS